MRYADVAGEREDEERNDTQEESPNKRNKAP